MEGGNHTTAPKLAHGRLSRDLGFGRRGGGGSDSKSLVSVWRIFRQNCDPRRRGSPAGHPPAVAVVVVQVVWLLLLLQRAAVALQLQCAVGSAPRQGISPVIFLRVCDRAEMQGILGRLAGGSTGGC